MDDICVMAIFSLPFGLWNGGQRMSDACKAAMGEVFRPVYLPVVISGKVGMCTDFPAHHGSTRGGGGGGGDDPTSSSFSAHCQAFIHISVKLTLLSQTGKLPKPSSLFLPACDSVVSRLTELCWSRHWRQKWERALGGPNMCGAVSVHQIHGE